MNIGIFDSGLGGLTIFKAILQKLPQYNYVYLGDNARVPYGNKSEHLVRHYTETAVKFLFAHDCQLVIIACNTATSVALRQIQQQLLPQQFPERRVLGVIRPAVEAALLAGSHKIGVIGTRLTINSACFAKEIHKVSSDVIVLQQACPVLVPLIEEGFANGPEIKLILTHYLEPLLKQHIDTLILGCTHYELLQPVIREIVGEKVQIIFEGAVVAEKLQTYLVRHQEITSRLTLERKRTYYVTDVSDEYEKLVRLFMGEHFTPADTLTEVEL